MRYGLVSLDVVVIGRCRLNTVVHAIVDRKMPLCAVACF
jgi:hypothetical protein